MLLDDYSSILQQPLFTPSFYSFLIQEILYNNIFCLFFCQAKRAQLQKLFIVDSSDRCLMNNCGIHIFGTDFRNRSYLRMIHDNRIALDMRLIAFGWKVCTDSPFPTDLEMICAELSSPFNCTSILDSACCFPSVISRSVTNNFAFFASSTFVSRRVESTPLICDVSSVNTEFYPT